jgi:hypothetical protein
MPSWPTLYPLLMHYKRTPNFPYGTGDSSLNRQESHITNDIFPDGLKARELYAKYILLMKKSTHYR